MIEHYVMDQGRHQGTEVPDEGHLAGLLADETAQVVKLEE
jgi:hypothetical protein